MKKSFLIVGLGLALLNSSALQAGSITLSSVGGTKFATKDGQLLTQGCAVRLGSFNLPNSTRNQILPEKGDYAQLKSVFKPLAEGLIGAGSAAQADGSGTVIRANSFPAAGDVFGSVTNFSASYMPPGTQLYVWVFNHSNPDQATQWGLFTSSEWLAPSALGNQTLSTTAVVTPIQGNATGGQLRLIDVPATYGNWAWQNYTLNAPSALTQTEADPDGDGLANLAEYAWKLNPAARSQSLTELSVSSSSATVSFTFKRPRHQPDVAVIAECSPDLRTWQPASAVVIGSDADFDTLRCSSGTETRCFWRVRFESVP